MDSLSQTVGGLPGMKKLEDQRTGMNWTEGGDSSTPSLAALFDAEARRRCHNRMAQYYPEGGPFRRELYAKHMEFFRAGAVHRERLFIAGNRVGKTEGVSAYELTLHLTGEYPAWWQGRRFDRPINAWAAGDTNQTTRDILQAKLLGKLSREAGDRPNQAMGLGTGMIPLAKIRKTRPKSGTPDAVETVWVEHGSGGISILAWPSNPTSRAGRHSRVPSRTSSRSTKNRQWTSTRSA